MPKSDWMKIFRMLSYYLSWMGFVRQSGVLVVFTKCWRRVRLFSKGKWIDWERKIACFGYTHTHTRYRVAVQLTSWYTTKRDRAKTEQRRTGLTSQNVWVNKLTNYMFTMFYESNRNHPSTCIYNNAIHSKIFHLPRSLENDAKHSVIRIYT